MQDDCNEPLSSDDQNGDFESPGEGKVVRPIEEPSSTGNLKLPKRSDRIPGAGSNFDEKRTAKELYRKVWQCIKKWQHNIEDTTQKKWLRRTLNKYIHNKLEEKTDLLGLLTAIVALFRVAKFDSVQAPDVHQSFDIESNHQGTRMLAFAYFVIVFLDYLYLDNRSALRKSWVKLETTGDKCLCFIQLDKPEVILKQFEPYRDSIAVTLDVGQTFRILVTLPSSPT